MIVSEIIRENVEGGLSSEQAAAFKDAANTQRGAPEQAMMLHEVLGSDKFIQVMFKAQKKKRNNPKRSKTTRMNSFIDTFGGIAGYNTPDTTGSGGMTHNA